MDVHWEFLEAMKLLVQQHRYLYNQITLPFFLICLYCSHFFCARLWSSTVVCINSNFLASANSANWHFQHEARRQLAVSDPGQVGGPCTVGLWQLHSTTRGATLLGYVFFSWKTWTDRQLYVNIYMDDDTLNDKRAKWLWQDWIQGLHGCTSGRVPHTFKRIDGVKSLFRGNIDPIYRNWPGV